MSEIRGAATGEHGYLSIREVLDELVGDFDDITISKIRFLESRGLIHPERTPSGYRKFFPADVDRLRWILRQQRENFLPLKVIKRRLDLEDGLDVELPDSPSLFDDAMETSERDRALATVVSNIRHAARPEIEEPPTMSEHHHQAIVNDSVSSLQHREDETSAPKPYLAAVPTHETRAAMRETAISEPSDVGAKHPNHPSQVEQPHTDATRVATESTPPNESAFSPEMARKEPEPPARETASNSVERATKRTDTTVKVGRVGSEGQTRPRATPGEVNALGDVWMSIDELASAASATVEAVAELEEFGFIASQDVGGIPCFDGDALVITKAIIGLRAYGLEARHLKSIRHAAERDAALYGQVVTPLLRQRNPEARARAKTQLEELAERGSALYEQILRTELRRLGGA